MTSFLGVIKIKAGMLVLMVSVLTTTTPIVKNFIFNLTTAIKLDQCLSTDPECGANDGNVGYLANQDQRTYGATFGGVTIYT